MRLLIISFLTLLSFVALAQNNGKIEGTVLHSDNKPLEQSTVSLVSSKDSVVLSYTLTTDKGHFELLRVPTGKDLTLFVSHVNAEGYAKQLFLKPGEKINLGTILLGGVAIEEVLITHVPPIRLNGDTLEYKADYFKTRPNASVEELLRLLPGLQVNVDGTIYYQGREISGIRVNDKDFFAHDLTMATRNLDASLVDIIQVVKDKGDSKREILDDVDLPLVINIKTKKNFVKADFGKFYGSGGTRERYESGALINTFRDTLQISFIGYANNLSRNGFDYSELRQYGGMDRAENNSRSYMSYGGLQNKISLGINANYDIGKKLKTNLMYSFDQQNDYVDNKSTMSTFYDAVTERGSSNSKSTYKDYRHQIRAFGRYAIDSTSRVSLEMNLSLGRNTDVQQSNSNTIREINTPVRDSENGGSGLSIQNNYRHNFYIEKKFPQSKVLLSFRQNLNSRTADRDNRRGSLDRLYLFGDSIVDQTLVTLRNSDGLAVDNSLNLQIPVAKTFNWDWYARYNWQLERELEDINNRINSDEFISRNDIANNKQGKYGYTYFGTKLNASFFKKKLRLSVGLEWLNLDRDYYYYDKAAPLTEAKQYWLPNANATYKGINLSYSSSVNLPSFYSIVAVNSDLYPTSITFASPYFDNVNERTARLRYFKSFKNLKFDFNGAVGYTSLDMSLGNRRMYNVVDGTSTTERYQAGPTERWFADLGFTKRFVQNKVWNISWQSSGYMSANENYSDVNGVENFGRSLYSNLDNTLTLTYKNKFTFIPTYGINVNATKNETSAANFRDVTNATHSFGTVFRLDDIKKFRIETSYTLRNQVQGVQSERTNIHLINSSVYYPVMASKGEIKFTVFDLLNQNQNIWFSGFDNSNYYQEQLTLRQYFLMGFVYKFLSSSGK